MSAPAASTIWVVSVANAPVLSRAFRDGRKAQDFAQRVRDDHPGAAISVRSMELDKEAQR